jgi:hypothetical protein
MTDKTAEEVRNYWTNIERETTRFTEEQSKKRYALHKKIDELEWKLKAEQGKRPSDDTMITMYDAVVSQRDQMLEDLEEEREKREALERGKKRLLELLDHKRQNLNEAWGRISMLEKQSADWFREAPPRMGRPPERVSVCYACGKPRE